MLAPTLSIPLASPHGGNLRFGAATSHLPPSPPIEDLRCSLPSISKLLGLADAQTPGSETPPPAYLIQPSPLCQDSSSKRNYAEFTQAFAHGQGSRASQTSVRTALPAGHLPPTPPLQTERSFDGRDGPLLKLDSPPAITTFVNNRLCETTPPCEPDLRPYPAASAHASTPRCLPTPCHQHQPLPTPFSAPSPVSSCCAPAAPPGSSLHPAIPGLAYQLPLPQGFRPLMNPSPGPSLWQQQQHHHHHHHHHHYPSTPHEAAFSHGQDKYVCATCRKAFSRPSSLRIHIHSHTGEKPFKCPHAGCGKAFSVRSNMKRHERGCHNFELGDRSPLRGL